MECNITLLAPAPLDRLGKSLPQNKSKVCHTTGSQVESAGLKVRTMTQLIKKIHMYSGLVSFTALLIFGLIGIVATCLPHPDERPRPEASAYEIDCV